MSNILANTDWMVPGALAEYSPFQPGGPWFPCVIASERWMLGEHTEVVRVEGLPDAYCEHTQLTRHSVPCAATTHVKRRCT